MTAQDDPLTGLAASLSVLGRAVEAARSEADRALQPVKEAHGLDDHEVVTVVIGPSCHIADVSLEPRWRRKREPEELGEAVGQGHEAARMAQDAALARLVYEAIEAGRKPERQPLPFGLHEVLGPPTRSYSVMVTDFLDYQARDAGRPVFGHNSAETVTVEANRRGFVLCDVDPRWADTAENWEITGGVVEASDDARESLEQTDDDPDAALDIAYDAVRIIWQNK